MVDNSTQISTRLYNDGAIYGFYLRREVSKMLSFELGYSFRKYFGYLGDHHVTAGGFDSHQIPLKANLDIDVYKDRISLFASFGYLFCIEVSGGDGSFTQWNHQGESITIEWKSIPESKYHSLFSGSIGSRFRVFDELLLEMELGYTFGFEDLTEYNITYRDSSETVQTLSVKGKGEYWYLKVGISYPIQRACELIRKGVSSLS